MKKWSSGYRHIRCNCKVKDENYYYHCPQCGAIKKSPIEKRCTPIVTEYFKRDLLLRSWKDINFDTSSHLTPQFSQFSRDFIDFLKDELKREGNFMLHSTNIGHFETSGFIVDSHFNFVYFNVSDVRFYKNDWWNSILIRRAKDERDYVGESNHYTDLRSFADNIQKLIKG